ncbi:hypothetical protein [Kitasatospora sp. NPDC051914]|uniref:hypothetical protein n=1 Tax=Kitasatospora sp. NPDC051914 TaxID=3154945 RepID=UPI00341FC4A0
MLIHGTEGPLVPGEPLTTRPGFWAAHLLLLCRSSDTRPEWFGGDGADADSTAESLFDEQAWPVFRVPFTDGHTVVLVYGNSADDPAIELLLTHSDWSRPETVLVADGDRTGPGLSWSELYAVASSPDPAADGLHATAVRLLLLLPALRGPGLPADAAERIAAALCAVGAPPATAPTAAAELLRGTVGEAGHSPCEGSPLSGGTGRGPADCGLPRRLNLSRAQSDRLARALGVPACGC